MLKDIFRHSNDGIVIVDTSLDNIFVAYSSIIDMLVYIFVELNLSDRMYKIKTRKIKLEAE